MRHAKRHSRLNRPLMQRKSLLRHLVTGLVLHERITTTFRRAKETQKLADRLITWGKDGSLAARREVFSLLQDRTLTKRLFADLAPLFHDRRGGYTRVIRLNRRKGDGAEMAVLELVSHTVVVPPKPAAKKAKTTKSSTARPSAQAAATEAEPTTRPPAASADAPSTEAKPESGKAKEKKGFLGGLRDAFRRKKTDE